MNARNRYGSELYGGALYYQLRNALFYKAALVVGVGLGARRHLGIHVREVLEGVHTRWRSRN